MTPESPSWPHLLEQLLRGEALTAPQATQLMQAWLAEELTPVQTGAFLAGLRAKPPVADELAAMAAVLREARSTRTRPLELVERKRTSGHQHQHLFVRSRREKTGGEGRARGQISGEMPGLRAGTPPEAPWTP